MKRLFVIGAVLAMTAPAFAQKANLRKLTNKIDYATPPAAYDLSNVSKEDVEELRELSAPTLTNPETEGNHKAWQYACRLKVWEMNHLLKEYQANNNTFPNPGAFFQNQYDIVKYYLKFYDVMNTPNEKGKLPLKKDEMDKEIALAQQATKGARGNLIIGASNLVYDNPQETVKLLDLFYQSADHPLFEKLNVKDDPQYTLGYYIYAVALKATGGDEATYLEYLQKSLDTEQGALAAQDLITYYKGKGDKENEKKVLAQAAEKYPQEVVFAINLIQNEVMDHNYDKAIEIADKTIANIESGVAPAVNKNGEKIDGNKWPYYFKAVALYSQEKLQDAYDAFNKAREVEDNFDNLSGAANCAAMLAIRSAGDKAKGNQWYDKAIELYEKCRTDYPEKDDVWGPQLYVCYNNKASLNNSQEMLKKAKPFEKYKGK